MRFSPLRRSLLLGLAAAPALFFCTPVRVWAGAPKQPLSARLAELEKDGLRLGVAVCGTADDSGAGYRYDERFPLCSTCKVLVCSAVLRKSMRDPDIMRRRIRYREADLLSWAPVTRNNLAAGMTVADLCAAAMQQSDNTATNLLIDLLGGPHAVTAFARSIGDREFRLDRKEPDVNTCLPGDERDTTTPLAMAATLRTLLTEDALGTAQQKTLRAWLIGNTTGAECIRAGVPAGWSVGDKTGNGNYGTTNDVGVVWPPSGKPVFLAVYLTQREKDAPLRKDVIASATRLVFSAPATG